MNLESELVTIWKHRAVFYVTTSLWLLISSKEKKKQKSSGGLLASRTLWMDIKVSV